MRVGNGLIINIFFNPNGRVDPKIAGWLCSFEMDDLDIIGIGIEDQKLSIEQVTFRG